jgi:hypothetical protein
MATLEERIAALEKRVERLEALGQSAAGQMREARKARTVEELVRIMLVVAGNWDAMGKGGNQTK